MFFNFYNNIRPHMSNKMKTPKEMRISAANKCSFYHEKTHAYNKHIYLQQARNCVKFTRTVESMM